MRGFFGRNRMEKPQPGVMVSSYEEALYPPRAFRYHVQQQTFPPQQHQQQSVIVLPSIDADAICEPHLKTVQAGAFAGGPPGGSTQVLEKRPPPALREYFPCYAPSCSVVVAGSGATDPERDRGSEDFGVLLRYAQLEGRAAGWVEPLNIFHYPQLLAFSSTDGTVQLDEALARHAVTTLADTLGLPLELRTFAAPVSNAATGALKLNHKTESRLRIRAAARHRPARVLRRGAKVSIIASAQPPPGFTGHHSNPKLAPATTTGGGAEGGGPAASHGKRPRPGDVLDLLNEDDEEGRHPRKGGRGEEDGGTTGGRGGEQQGPGRASAGGQHPGDGWGEDHDDEPEDNEDDDELSVDLYDAADDDDQADVDDMGDDDDGGDYL